MSTDKGKVGRSICRDVQALLFDYMSREIGPARSEFVREHVRRCDECRAELNSIQKTFELLTLARAAPVPDKLSPYHRERIDRAVRHPIFDWICNHRFLTAMAVTIAVLLLAVFCMRWAMDIEEPDNSGAVPIDLTPRPIPGMDAAGTPELLPPPDPPVPRLQENAK